MNVHRLAARARRVSPLWALRAYVGVSTLVTFYLATMADSWLNYRALVASGPAGFWVAGVFAALSLVVIADVVVNDLLPERYHLRWVIRRRLWLFMLLAVGQLGMGLVVVRYDDDAPHLLARLLADATFAAITAWMDVLRRGDQ